RMSASDDKPGETERVPVVERPDVVTCCGFVQVRVGVRNGAVGIDAYDLADQGAVILRRLETQPSAGGVAEGAGGRRHQPSAQMAAADRLRLLPRYHSHVSQRKTLELAARHRRAFGHGIGEVLELAQPRIGLGSYMTRPYTN